MSSHASLSPLCLCLTLGTQIPAPTGTLQQLRLPTRTAQLLTSPPCHQKTRAPSPPGAGAATAGTEPASSSLTMPLPLMAPSGKVRCPPLAPWDPPSPPLPQGRGEREMREEVLDFPSPISWPQIPSLLDALPQISSPLTLHLSLFHLHVPPPRPSGLFPHPQPLVLPHCPPKTGVSQAPQASCPTSTPTLQPGYPPSGRTPSPQGK